ncbi:MAG: FlgD immunoglobulin-like domain containing protein, partial [Nitrospirota bacterium]
KDTILTRYLWSDIGWLRGKKLRIAAEDFAGNRSAAISNFLEEKIILFKWDNQFVSEVIPAYLENPGLHSIWGLETIRLPIVSMNVQYWTNRQWFDASPVVNSPSGIVNFKWDNSIFNPEEGYAVRIKAVDILGQEHYSNTLYTVSIFSIKSTCNELVPVVAVNYLFEKLALLKFQVQSDNDPNYSQWTDYEVYDSTKGDTIQEGIFVPPLPNLQLGMTYKLKMIGIGLSGKIYGGDITQYPPTCPVKISLNVSYDETGCGLISGMALLSTGIKKLSGNVSFKTLSYYIQKLEGLQLLRQFDLIREGWGSVTVDTSNMLEGSYPVKAVLTYLDLNDNTSKEASATNTLIVDRVPPTAQITYPGKNLMLCPVKVTDPKGDWYGIPVEGIAWDNNNVNRYELYYGIGDNPLQWMPATTKNSKGESICIARNGPIKGQLGIWDVTNLKGTTFSLELKVVDVAGNVSCYITSFSIDNLIEITNLNIDKSLFSPNGDGILDDMNISYQIDEYAAVDVRVFKLFQRADGSYVLDSMPVRTIVSGLQHLSGSENTSWDGKGDSGMAVADGKYGIAVFAKDSCGNTNMRWLSIEVDNTPPIAIINYPRPPDILGNIVEVKGTADDLHFLSYTLEAGQGDNPDTWVLISSNTTPLKENILGKWNTFGLEGKWTLRLTAIDTVGNKNTATVTIDLGARKNLIKDLDATPKLFSPNNDGKLDTANINYELTDACDVKFEIFDSSGTIKKSYTTTTSSAGTYTYTWDGKDNTGAVVSDSIYSIKLTAVLSSNPSVTQDEAITVIVDSSPPTVDIKQPVDNSYIKTDVSVNGTISDKNLVEYSVIYTGDVGSVLLDKANQNRENYTFGIINGPPEDEYSLKATARDLGENTTEKSIAFTIDRTPPKVTLDTPKEGEYYGSDKNTINITGTIVERNLETYSLRYGLGDNPSASGGWTDLLSGNTVPTNIQLFSWKVGKGDGIPDGIYTLSLYVKDKAGSEAEVKVKVKIDNTLPETSITSLRDGDYVKTAIEIKGTASDSNLDKYTLEISEGICSSAFKWATIKTSTTLVKDGLLATWQTLPPDGDYCIRLTAIDKVGNKAEAKVNIKVDTHPPTAPLLSGKIEDKSNARLNWTQNIEPDLAGYNLYRDNQKVNTALIKDINYLDQNLKEGIYTYTVIAVDLAGWENESSNEIKITIDLTGPDARIRSPQDDSKVSSFVDIKGTAYSYNDFKQYRVYIGQGPNPSQWNLIRTSPVPIPYGSLAQWNTFGLSEGLYSIKLEAEDLTGNINSQQIIVTVDNTPPASPLLISATASGSDVTLTWQANTEPDLSGYLLYRNDQLANVSGIVIGDLKPYLIAGTTYLDKVLPDGKFKYYLLAMDQAGNISDQSNTIEVDIDTHPP